FAGFQIAIFSFVGIEIAGTTAAEVKEPKKVLPKAINAIPLRIVLFYIFSLVVIMSVTPWDQVVPEKSPFVSMFWLAGIPIAAGLINFVV
ncbi:amino acid permease, partial [Bartonella sp. AA83SXKL]